MRRTSFRRRFLSARPSGPALAGIALIAASAGAARGQDVGRAQDAERLRAIEGVLDALHEAAAAADLARYSSLYARDAVFLGTDASERWTRDEFMAYAKARFERGSGWAYTPIERHVYVAADGRTAWFDERLSNENLGETRGTGVLVAEEGTWRVAQYNLTIPIPNELAREFVARIRACCDP